MGQVTEENLVTTPCSVTTGKDSVRVALVEASWWLIRKNKAMRIKYEKIKAHAGAKRAIVAVARNLLPRIRRMILDDRPYAFARTV